MEEASVWQPIIYKASFFLGILATISIEFVAGCAVIVVSSILKKAVKDEH